MEHKNLFRYSLFATCFFTTFTIIASQTQRVGATIGFLIGTIFFGVLTCHYLAKHQETKKTRAVASTVAHTVTHGIPRRQLRKPGAQASRQNLNKFFKGGPKPRGIAGQLYRKSIKQGLNPDEDS